MTERIEIKEKNDDDECDYDTYNGAATYLLTHLPACPPIPPHVSGRCPPNPQATPRRRA